MYHVIVDKTVKLWKIYEKNYFQASSARESVVSGGGLCLPRITKSETATQSYQRRAYQNAHAYNINSISLCGDGETFSSADDLRINCWNLEYSDRCFSKLLLAVDVDAMWHCFFGIIILM